MIVKHARGIPRVINILCDNAFLEGYALSRKRIDVDIVRGVIKDREGFVTHRVIPLHAPAFLKEWRRLTLGLTAFNMRVCVVILPLLFVAAFLFYGPASLRPKSADTVAVGPMEIVRADASPSASFLPASSGTKGPGSLFRKGLPAHPAVCCRPALRSFPQRDSGGSDRRTGCRQTRTNHFVDRRTILRHDQ